MSKNLSCEIDERFSCKSFIIIRPESDYYKKFDKFSIINHLDNSFCKSVYLVDIQNYTLKDLPENLIFLDQNCTKEIFTSIQALVYNTYKRVTLLEHPKFLEDLKNVIGVSQFEEFEPKIYQTFKPLKLVEIFDLYKKYYPNYSENFYKINQVINESYVFKRLSVLTFSEVEPIFITNKKIQNYGISGRPNN